MIEKTLLLDAKDNIVICIQPISAGDVFQLDKQTITAEENIAIGHKLARVAIAADEKIFRYGAPIGSAMQNIQRGEHVHLHNMRSDYIPSHTRSQQQGNPHTVADGTKNKRG